MCVCKLSLIISNFQVIILRVGKLIVCWNVYIFRECLGRVRTLVKEMSRILLIDDINGENVTTLQCEFLQQIPTSVSIMSNRSKARERVKTSTTTVPWEEVESPSPLISSSDRPQCSLLICEVPIGSEAMELSTDNFKFSSITPWNYRHNYHISESIIISYSFIK